MSFDQLANTRENTGGTSADSLWLWDKSPAKVEWQNWQNTHIWEETHA